MSQLYYSTEQSFYKIIIKSKKNINFRLYEMHAYNSHTNVLCGIGNYETQDSAFIVGVQLKTPDLNTQQYIVGVETYTSGLERIPHFILVHKKTKKQIKLAQPNGSVAFAENFRYTESTLIVMVKPSADVSEDTSDEPNTLTPFKPLYKPEKSITKPIIETIDKSFVPNELRGNK